MAPSSAAVSKARSSTATARSASAALSPERGLLFGAFVDSAASPTTPAAADSQSALERFEERNGRKLDLHRLFLRWDDPLTRAAADVERRRTPVLSIQPTRRNGTRLTW